MEIVNKLVIKKNSGNNQYTNSNITIEERFWKYVDKKTEDECWKWIGATLKNNYGVFWDGNKYVKAHRFSYILAYGSIPNDKPIIMHACNNPSCVNPKHLVAGTQKDNIQQMYDENRDNLPRGENQYNSKKKLKEIEEIRKKYSTGKYTYITLSKEHNISTAQIKRIVNNRQWIDDNYDGRTKIYKS